MVIAYNSLELLRRRFNCIFTKKFSQMSNVVQSFALVALETHVTESRPERTCHDRSTPEAEERTMATKRVFDLAMGAEMTLPGYANATHEPSTPTRDVTPADEAPEATDVWVGHMPCCRPLAGSLRLTDRLPKEWVSKDPMVLELLQRPIEEVYRWLQENQELQVAIVDHTTVEDKWRQLFGDMPGRPTLEPKLELAALYKWGVELSWGQLGARAKNEISTSPARGGGSGQRSQAFTVDRLKQYRELEGETVIEFRIGDRTVMLSGLPLRPGPDLEHRRQAVAALHEDPGAGTEHRAGPGDQIEMLPVVFGGDGTARMGIDRMLGTASTDGMCVVTRVAGNCATSITVDGIKAEAMAFMVVRYGYVVGMGFKQQRRFRFHDGKGNQWVRLTVWKAGEVEWQIEMGNSCHAIEE